MQSCIIKHVAVPELVLADLLGIIVFLGSWFSTIAIAGEPVIPKYVPRAKREFDKGAIKAIAWSPDARVLALSCGDDRLRFWRIGSPDPIEVAMPVDKPHDLRPGPLAWSPDGGMLVVGTMTSFLVIEPPVLPADGPPTREPRLVAWLPTSPGRDPTGIAWLPDATRIVICARAEAVPTFRERLYFPSTLTIWPRNDVVSKLDLRQEPNYLFQNAKGEMERGPIREFFEMATVAVSGDGTLVAVGGRWNYFHQLVRAQMGIKDARKRVDRERTKDADDRVSDQVEWVVCVWSIADGVFMREFPTPPKSQKEAYVRFIGVHTVRFVSPTKLVAFNDSAQFLDVETGTIQPAPVPPNTVITCADAPPTGSCLVTGCRNGSILVWDREMSRPPTDLQQLDPKSGDAPAITAIAITPDQRWLAVGDVRGDLRIFEIAAPETD